MGAPFGSKVVTLVRGEALRDVRNEPLPAPARTVSTPPSAPIDSQGAIYDVPVSAIQHCCGRGCQHCRIYWRGKKT